LTGIVVPITNHDWSRHVKTAVVDPASFYMQVAR